MEINKPTDGQHIETEDIFLPTDDAKKLDGSDNEDAQQHVNPKSLDDQAQESKGAFGGDVSEAPDEMVPPDELPEFDGSEMIQEAPIERHYPDSGITVIPNGEETIGPIMPDYEMDPDLEISPEMIEPDLHIKASNLPSIAEVMEQMPDPIDIRDLETYHLLNPEEVGEGSISPEVREIITKQLEAILGPETDGDKHFDPMMLTKIENVLEAGHIQPAEMPVIDTNDWTSALGDMFEGHVDNPNQLLHVEPAPMDAIVETDLGLAQDDVSAAALKL